MTCIIGYKDGDKVYIGADSLGSNGYLGRINKNKKVFKLKDSANIIAGYTDSFRMGQILQYSKGLFDELSLLQNKINEEYMITKFIPTLQKKFSEGGFERNNNGEKKAGNFIVAVKDKLYEVQGDYSVLEPHEDFCAVGCGQDFAYGSLCTTKDMDIAITERIIKALESAEQCAVGVQRPFYIINTENDEVIEIK